MSEASADGQEAAIAAALARAEQAAAHFGRLVHAVGFDVEPASHAALLDALAPE